MSQTTIQNTKAIRTGSVKVQVSADDITYTDIGAIRKADLESLSQVLVIKFDNAPEIKKFSEGDKAKFSFDMAEINFENLAMLRDGHIVTVENVSDVTVTFNGGGKLTGKYMRIENTDALGKKFTVNMTNVTMTSNMKFPFIADDEADVMTMPVEVEGYITSIVDQQII